MMIPEIITQSPCRYCNIMGMNVLIIEDEKHNADRLIRLLHSCHENIIVHGPLSSVAEIRSFFQNDVNIDLIFSDIRLTDGLSFDAFIDIPDTIPVIFTTAYDEYALKAFNYNGIAYLLKPIDKEELAQAVRKSKKLFSPAAKEISEIFRMLHDRDKAYRQRFLVVEKDGYTTVPVSEISYISTDSGVVRLFTKKGKQYPLDMTLDDIEAQLDPMCFFRATRQQIVNITSVKRISNWFNRKIKIIILEYPDTEIVVGKEKVTRFKQWLDR